MEYFLTRKGLQTPLFRVSAFTQQSVWSPRCKSLAPPLTAPTLPAHKASLSAPAVKKLQTIPKVLRSVRRNLTLRLLITYTGSSPQASFIPYALSGDNDYTSRAIQLHSIQIIPLLAICMVFLLSKYNETGRKIKWRRSAECRRLSKNHNFQELRKPPPPRQLVLKYQYTCLHRAF